MGPKSSSCEVREIWPQMHGGGGGGGHAVMESRGLPAAARRWEEAEEPWPCQHLDFGILAPERRENNSLLFLVTSLVVICYGRTSKLIQVRQFIRLEVFQKMVLEIIHLEKYKLSFLTPYAK